MNSNSLTEIYKRG